MEDRKGSVKQNQRILLKKAEVTEMFGWSSTTIWRKVKERCFPSYRLSSNDVRFKLEEILYYIESKREGSFNEREGD